jgi:UDP-N-acetylmuramate--alanine ligase
MVQNIAELPGAVARLTRPGDVVLTLGAGSIGGVAAALVAELQARRSQTGGV